MFQKYHIFCFSHFSPQDHPVDKSGRKLSYNRTVNYADVILKLRIVSKASELSFEERKLIMKIMIVDDEPVYIDIIREFIKEVFPISIIKDCCNSKDALGSIDLFEPDLLISDIIMPGTNGLALSRKVKQTKPELPIVLMSSNIEFAVDCFDIGVNGFLLKPLVKSKVLSTLAKF